MGLGVVRSLQFGDVFSRRALTSPSLRRSSRGGEATMFLQDHRVSLGSIPGALTFSRFRLAGARVPATLGRLRVANGPTCLPRATSIPSMTSPWAPQKPFLLF